MAVVDTSSNGNSVGMGGGGRHDRITELASIISTHTAVVSEYLTSNNLPPLSNDEGAPSRPSIPAHEVKVVEAQDTVLAATQELGLLMKGPTEGLLGMSIVNPNETLALQGAYHYQIAKHIPLHSSATYTELSERCGLNATELRRLVRMGASAGLFAEVEGSENKGREYGRVKHTAMSRVLREDAGVRDIVGVMCEEMAPGCVRTIDALDKWGPAKSPEQSGFSLGQGTEKGLYGVLGDYPERGQRFASAMSGFASRSGVDTLANSFDWGDVKSVVDVGGGRGEVSLGLAEKFKHLDFVVQDLQHVVEEAASSLNGQANTDGEGAGGRVRFQSHNYFEEQNQRAKDVYYFRYIFHNLPDESCVRLLKAQIPALKQGAHIIIQDAVIPEPQVDLPPYKEKYRRSMDLVMLTFFGSRERTLREWKDIANKADPRFEVNFRGAASGHQCDILDVMWESGKRTIDE